MKKRKRLWLDAYVAQDMATEDVLRILETVEAQSQVDNIRCEIVCDESIILVKALYDPKFAARIEKFLASGILVIEKTWRGEFATTSMYVLEPTGEAIPEENESFVLFQDLICYIRRNATTVKADHYVLVNEEYQKLEKDMDCLVSKHAESALNTHTRFSYSAMVDPNYFAKEMKRKRKGIIAEYKRLYAKRNVILHRCDELLLVETMI